MPTFEDHNEAQQFTRTNKPPAGMKWAIDQVDGDFSSDSMLRVPSSFVVYPTERWPIEHPALSNPDKWTLESGDPLP